MSSYSGHHLEVGRGHFCLYAVGHKRRPSIQRPLDFLCQRAIWRLDRSDTVFGAEPMRGVDRYTLREERLRALRPR